MEKSWLKENLLKLIVVTVACLAGAGYGSYLLYYDWIGESSRGNGPALAQVTRRDQTVRRKSAKSFAWVRAEEADPLFKKDSVQTSSDSAAVIKFKNGNSLEIGENSLVVIDDIENLELNFASALAQGSVILRTDRGDQRMSVSADGKVQVEKIPVRLEAPEPLARMYVGGNAESDVEFRWKAGSQPPEKLFVLISPDRSFAPGKTIRREAAAASAAFTASLKPGKYFWRLDDARAPLTEVSQFTIVSVVAPKPAFPARGEEIATPQLSFRWFTNADVADPKVRAILEVATDASFTKVLQAIPIQPETSQKEVALEAALAGKPLVWRTRLEYPGGNISSRGESFRLLSAAEVQEKGALALVGPAPDQKLYYWDQPTEFKFSWRAESEAPLGYVFELASDAQFKRVLVSKTLDRTSLSSREANVPEGQSYWRVRALDGKNREVARSEARTLSYGVHPTLRAPASVLAKPAQGANYELLDDNANPKLSWEKIEDAQAYQVAVFKDGKPIAQKLVADTTVTLPDLPEGKLSWTVRAIDRLKRPGALMDRQEFNLSFGTPLGKPVVTSPEVQ